MTTVTIYQNRYNHNKYLEVHNDGHYHNSVRQFIGYKTFTNEKHINYNGDKFLHRWKINNLRVLLSDYVKID